MENFCIVIPVYSEKPSNTDKICLKQIYKICSTHDIYFVSPEGLKLNAYNKLLKDYEIKVKYFNKLFFKDTYSYSQLCLYSGFYNEFKEYEYMYIIQTDVWMFRDDLQIWVDKGYDYVGPPVISKGSLWKHVPTVGNGGFSLRKISTMVEMFAAKGELRTEYPQLNEIWNKIEIEDKFICDELRYFWDMNIPTVQEAFTFGWDQNVDYIYENITKEFPMGAHAVDKCIGFWKNHIKEFSKPAIMKECYTKLYKMYCHNYGKEKADELIGEDIKYVTV